MFERFDERARQAIVEEVVAALGPPAGDATGLLEEDGVAVRFGDELIGTGNPRTDVRVIGAVLRQDGLAAGWLRVAHIEEAWVREFGGGE